jgi:tellurite resistance protein TehA-like permease
MTAMLATRPAPTARLADALGSAAAAPVMGTGIVSAALAADGHAALADVMLAVAVAFALVLAAALAVAVARDRPRLERAAATPAALTVVAALCVLGARFVQVGSRGLGVAMLALGVVAWAPLLVRVLRAWRRQARGAGFLVCVATQAIAVLCALLGARGAAVAGLVAGLALYAFALASFDLAEVRRGRGDQWVAGGALAISALAAATAAHRGGALAGVALVLWAVAVAWLPVLVAGEALSPRTGYHPARWSTVFPVGMYAAMSHTVGVADGHAWMVDLARDWTWVAVAVWALVAAASVRRGLGPRP